MTPPPTANSPAVDHPAHAIYRRSRHTLSSKVSPTTTAATSRSTTLMCTIIALLLVFGILAAASMWRHGPVAGDGQIAQHLLIQRGTFAWRIADAVSFVASGPLVAMIALAAAAWLLIAGRRVVDALAVLAAPAVAGVVDRPRPLTAALTGESGNGFPSGHVTGFTALAVVVLVVVVMSADRSSRSLRVPWAMATALSIVAVMWSRVAVGAHYPSDTVGGVLLGAAIGLMCVPAMRHAAVVAGRARRRVTSQNAG
jgi:membrane-associated phospholipid phosphatase